MKVEQRSVIGTPPTLEWVSVERLSIDEEYQRTTESVTSKRLISQMALCWDWRLCLPLSVSRRADGGLFVIDGQHRLAGAMKRGDILHLPCVITNFPDGASEARTFVSLNQKRQRLNQGEVFRAAFVAGDETARLAQRLIERAGLSHAKTSNTDRWSPRQIFCGPKVAGAVKRYGEEVVSNALVAMSEAYPDKVVTSSATMLQALFLIYSEDAKRPGFDPDVFIQAMGSVEPSDWRGFAADCQERNPSLSRRESHALAIMEVYDDFRSNGAD